ncbi:MAG: hypothetical protein FMNOHCHN_00308 [Ignavibacteriaceae bacterium]|nr:hypothetical protein [Ignavibacteriaceae bacterium]
MVVFRITTAQWAGRLSPSGYAARWNHAGDYVLYASEHRSLACLENLVHRSGNAFAGEFFITEILIPDEVSVEELPVPLANAITNAHESLLKTGEFGHQWYTSGRSCVLKVPSVVIRQEHNFVINTRHPLFAEIKTGLVEPFLLDSRLASKAAEKL